MVAGNVMVSPPVGVVHVPTNKTAYVSKNAETTKIQRNPPESTDSGPTRMKAGEMSLVRGGHKPVVAARITAPQSKSPQSKSISLER
jgi:hypothetical protein